MQQSKQDDATGSRQRLQHLLIPPGPQLEFIEKAYRAFWPGPPPGSNARNFPS